MANVLVVGGTGTLGREVVARLAMKKHHTRIMAHSSQATATPGIEVIPGDLASGTGLRDAVAGVDAIIHVATSFQNMDAVDIEGTQRLIDAASAVVPSPHLIYISIVGVDRTEFPYYAAKYSAESLIERSKLPWSILRATQFHSYVEYVLQSLGADSRTDLIVPAGVRLQPIDSAEVADRLVTLAELGPLMHRAEMGGPEILSMEAMAGSYLRLRGRSASIRSEPLANPMFDMFRSGIILAPDHAVGMTTWEAYLRQKYVG